MSCVVREILHGRRKVGVLQKRGHMERPARDQRQGTNAMGSSEVHPGPT